MVTHATTAAIFLIWVGIGPDDELPMPLMFQRLGISNSVNACGCAESPAYRVGHVGVWEEIPDCPECAVLYDEAMTAREELLGRKEAA